LSLRLRYDMVLTRRISVVSGITSILERRRLQSLSLEGSTDSTVAVLFPRALPLIKIGFQYSITSPGRMGSLLFLHLFRLKMPISIESSSLSLVPSFD